MRTLLILLSLSFSLLLSAQDAKEILGKSLKAVNSLEQASYHVDILQTSLLSGDTSRYSADCLLKRVPQDSLLKVYYYFSTASSGFTKYNGIAYYTYAPEFYNFVFRYTVTEHPEKFRAVKLPNGISKPEVASVVYYTYSLLRSGTEITSMLDEIRGDNSKNGIVLSVIGDTLVDGVKCYGFRTTRPKKNFITHKLILLDQENLLPVAVIKDFKGSAINTSKENTSLGEFSSVRYTKVKESVPRFDYLMSDKSLPKKVEVTDHLPFTEPFRIGDHAPALAIPLANSGRNISSDSLTGRILVLCFISTTCINGAEGNAAIKELYRNYGARKDVIFLNIFSSGSDSREKVEKYYKKQSLEGYTLFYSTGIEKTWGILGYPDFFLIDRHGRIAYFQRGYSGDLLNNMARQIEDCLARP